jgi:hypothetical protein
MKGPMTPLQKIAMGLVIVVLDTTGRYDALPDVFGWLLVLAGTSQLPVPSRGTLRGVAALAGVMSVVLWFPAIREPAVDADPSVAWAFLLPDLIFGFLLCRALMELARPSHPRDVPRYGSLSVLFPIMAAIPVVAFAAEREEWVVYADFAVALTWLWLIWTLFARNNREYAKP